MFSKKRLAKSNCLHNDNAVASYLVIHRQKKSLLEEFSIGIGSDLSSSSLLFSLSFCLSLSISTLYFLSTTLVTRN